MKNVFKIRVLEDSIYNMVCLDRDWFKYNDVIYYYGVTPVTISSPAIPKINHEGFYYAIYENMVFKAGDWFTLEKVIPETTDLKITIEIKITYE